MSPLGGGGEWGALCTQYGYTAAFLLDLGVVILHHTFILPGLCCINFSGCFPWGWTLNRFSAFKRLSPFNKAFPNYY